MEVHHHPHLEKKIERIFSGIYQEPFCNKVLLELLNKEYDLKCE